MPLYEYQCEKCEHSFEELVFGNETVACPNCQASSVHRLVSVPARPQGEAVSMPMTSCGEGPPCGAVGCRRTMPK